MFEERRYHEDMSVLHANCEPYRTYYVPYGSSKEALRDLREKSDRLFSLCGNWDFKFFPHYDEIPQSVLKNTARFDTIEVPSNWQFFGYDRIQYIENQYPFAFAPPCVPPQNPAGVYSREIEIAAGLEGLKTYLVFEGVDSCFYLYINGVFAGYSQGSHYMSEFEVSGQLVPGKNRITVVVLKWCDGSYLESGDRIRLSGIFRDVYLLARPKGHLRDVVVTTTLSPDYKTAAITLQLEAVNPQEARITLFSPGGEPIFRTRPDVYGTAALKVEDPLLWSAEAPELYNVLIEYAGEFITQQVGIREITTNQGVLRLNGRAIKLKGVNRQEFDPLTGTSVSERSMLEDLCLMKQNNINAVRVKAPPDPRFLSLCDRLGLYVVADADLDTGGTAFVTGGEISDYVDYFANDPEWQSALLDRVMRLYERDKNHASVIFWSLGSNTGRGPNLDAAARWLRQTDQSRPVLLEGAGEEVGDIIGLKNMDVSACEPLPENNAQPRPFLLCNLAESCGNALGGVAEMWEMVMARPDFCGAFVSQWSDQAIDISEEDARPKYIYGGDFKGSLFDSTRSLNGLITPDKQPKSALHCLKHIFGPIRVTPVNLPRGEFEIENLYHFIYLSRLECVVEITRFDEVVERQSLGALAIPPQRSERVRVQTVMPGNGECYIKFSFLQRGGAPWIIEAQEMAAFQFRLPTEIKPKPVKHAPAEHVFFKEGPQEYEIVGQGFVYTLDKENGLFSQLAVDGRRLLTRPMAYNLWRAPTDSDRQDWQVRWQRMGYDRLQLRNYSLTCDAEANRAIIRGQSALVAASVLAGINLSTLITVDPHGRIEFCVKCDIDQSFPSLPKFGLQLCLPGEYKNVAYFGMGPHESYADKTAHCFMGKHTGQVQELLEPYIRPQECGNRRETRWVRLTDEQGKGIMLYSNQGFNFSALPCTGQELENQRHRYRLPKSDQTVLCVDYAQTGVGGAYRETDPDAYTFNEKRFAFRFTLCNADFPLPY